MQRREVIESLSALAGALALPRLALGQTSSSPAASAAPVNLFEYEPLARQRITRMAYDYVAGGAGDEITLRRNRE